MTETALKKENLMAGLFGIDNSEIKEIELNDITRTKIAKEEVVEIPLEEIRDYGGDGRKHRFKMRPDKVEEIAKSIRIYGVLTPCILRLDKTGQARYECLAGGTRRAAARMAGKSTVPALIRDCTDEEAEEIMAATNSQREDLLASERAWMYRIQYDAVKRKSGRKRASERMGEPSSSIPKSADIVAEIMNTSDRAVQKYIRLTYLIPQILEGLIDTEKLSIKAGVQLSYLSEAVQQHIFDIIDVEQIKVNEQLAEKLRKTLSQNATMDEVFKILKSDMVPQKSVRTEKKSGITMNKNMKKKYFPKDFDEEKINNILVTLLDIWATENNPDYKRGELQNE